jgi:hypothetical protein
MKDVGIANDYYLGDLTKAQEAKIKKTQQAYADKYGPDWRKKMDEEEQKMYEEGKLDLTEEEQKACEEAEAGKKELGI